MTALVLLPGFDGTGLLLAGFAAAFGPDVEIVIVPYPTDNPLGYAGLESIARRHLPSNRPFFLLGESFSGPIAVSIAASRPPGLLGVILCCSFARNPLPYLATVRPLVRFFPFGSVPASWFSPFVLGRFSSPALRSALAMAVAAVAPAVLRERARAVLTVDVSALLSRIETPVLYLRALEDHIAPKSASDLIVALAPDARVVELVAPHFLLQAQPSAAASAVASFMALPAASRHATHRAPTERYS